MLLFADDIEFNAENRVELQLMINELDNYTAEWGLELNLNKSKIVVFRKGGNLSKYDKFFYKGNEIEIVKEYKYLGIIFRFNGSFINNFKEKAITSRLGINLLWKLTSNNLNIVSPKFKVFDATYKSLLLYGAQALGYLDSDILESVQRFFIKKLFSLPFNTPNYMLLLECGRHSLFISSLKLFLKFICKMSRLDDSRFIYICLTDSIIRNIGWCKSIRSLCNNLGINANFLNDFTNNPTNGISIENCELILFRALEQEKQDLFSAASNAQFHKSYAYIKKDFLMEEYMNNCNLPFKMKKLIIAARTEMFYVNSKPWISSSSSTCSENCLFCNNKESVIHILFQCNGYNSIRFFHFNRLIIDSELEQHKILNGTPNWETLGKFLTDIHSRRQIRSQTAP